MNVERNYVGIQPYLTWIKAVAQSVGTSPIQFLDEEINILQFVTSVTETGPGEVVGTLVGGLTLQVQYDPQALVVRRVEYRIDGELAYVWEGSMSVEAFLMDVYPVDVRYGSNDVDVLSAEDCTVYAGEGNDVIQLMGSGIAYGQGGMDVFDVSNWGHMTIKDYQPGEKILFPDYDSLTALAADFVGITPAANNGFTLHFRSGGQNGYDWSLTFENTAPDIRLLDDFLFGDAGEMEVYGPIFARAGWDLYDLA